MILRNFPWPPTAIFRGGCRQWPSGTNRWEACTNYEPVWISRTPPARSRARCRKPHRRLKHGYYASVSFTDVQVGRLLQEADRLGLNENTIIILWGDHGWKLGEHNGWCKQTNYEVDTRAPLMIYAARRQGQRAALQFLGGVRGYLPDSLRACRFRVPQILQGKSLTPLLAAPSAKVKDAAFSQFPRQARKARLHGLRHVHRTLSLC